MKGFWRENWVGKRKRQRGWRGGRPFFRREIGGGPEKSEGVGV